MVMLGLACVAILVAAGVVGVRIFVGSWPL